jgi:hypothetical protein
MSENLGKKDIEPSRHEIIGENLGRDCGAIGVFAFPKR